MVIKNWKMNFMEHEGLSCTAPCEMYSVLLKHGLISDPYYGTNEKELSFLSKNDCTFYSEFNLSDIELKKEKIELTFLGLDTICDIYFNGTLLESVKNMHRAYSYDIKSLAKKSNEITLKFKSPLEYFEKMENVHHIYMNGDTVPGASHLRKAFYMSGWDWAPTLPNMGIFRDVVVDCYDTDKLEDFSIIQHHENDVVKLDLSVTTKHSAPNLSVVAEIEGQRVTLENNKGEVIIENPRLWWPNGYGKQELYEIHFYLYCGNSLLDTVSKKIGLRTLVLSQDKDELGREFCFKVNGVKIFAMGANYVPMDNLLSRDTEKRTERLIKDCLFANFNCIRVWGGAYYPHDYFYDLCDKYGLIVWQDFMVACANIWLTEDMEKEFTAEIIYNVKRIRHHACLGILCGNNEMEEAICNWDCADGNDPLVRKDYLKLYEDIFPKLCTQLAPYISYTPSSPTSGGNFQDPQSFNEGDVHFWNVWNGNCGFDEYRKYKFRFCSEYGFESLPSFKTIMEFCPQGELNPLSYTMESHQKHWNGNVKLIRYLAEQYLLPKNLEATAYASQINQANAIKYGVEHFRRNRGYTMGSIYWQLNDPWPVASWSSVDYFGRYKALHYYAKRFYAPIELGLFNENGQITVNVANETMNDFAGYVKVGLMKNDFTQIWESFKDISVSSLSSLDVASYSSLEMNNKNDVYFYAELYDRLGNLLVRNTELCTKPKHFNFLKPTITVDAKEMSGGVMLSVCSNVFAKDVEISFRGHDVALSDNYFDLTNATLYRVFAKTDLTAKELLDSISVFSVYDIPFRY